MRARFFIVVIAGVILAGCSTDEKKAEAASTKQPEPIEVRTAAVETRKVDKTISVTGSLHPDETVSVSAEVPGRVSSILVDFGQNVRKGQVIAELDKQELNLALDRSRAALAQAWLASASIPSQENIARDHAVHTSSSRADGRREIQVRECFSSCEDRRYLSGAIHRDEKAYQSRQAALDAARDEARTLIANVQALKAEVTLAQKRLNDATVRAPFDGSVKEKLVSPGAYLKENTPIFTLMKTDPLRLRVDLPESAAGAVRVGTIADIHHGRRARRDFHCGRTRIEPLA